MGFGDVKLMGALGLFFGWRLTIMITLISFLLGAVIGVILIIKNRKKGMDYMPFGPFIVISTLICLYVPFNILMIIMLNIFTLGTINKKI